MVRPLVMGKNGLVTSPHPLATQAGLKILQEGGNAWEAAIAVSAVLSVVHSHLSGIGGDLFLLLYSSETQEYSCLNASGRSALAASIDKYNSLNYQHMPSRGILSVTVPGCVSAWGELWRKYGRMSWAKILQPAVSYAREGYPTGHHTLAMLENMRDIIRQDPGLRRVFMPKGKLPEPGQLLIQTELADTFEGIAHYGPNWFYRGEPAQKITAYLKARGGLISLEDMATHTASWGQPLSVSWGDYRLYQTPPNSQGLAALLAFNILDGLDMAALGGYDSSRVIHYLVEAKKIACQYREQYITDPEFVPVACEELLDKQFAARLRKMINPERAAAGPVSPVYIGYSECFIVRDGEGNLAAGSQGLHSPLGAGFLVPETGIILQNGGAGFSLDPGHINRLEPQKRPFHTLTATIAAQGNEPVLAVGVSGADSQLQVQLQLIGKLLQREANLQEILEQPRWLQGGAFPGDPTHYLLMEERFSLDEIGELESWGHNIRTIADWAWQTGEAQAVGIDPESGVCQAGTDPRGEGGAAAY